MSDRPTGNRKESKLGFLDSLAKLFRSEPKQTAAPAAPQAAGFDALRKDFESALRELKEKADETRRVQGGGSVRTATGAESAEERAADRARRLEAIWLAIRQDIGAMHAKLGTGLSDAGLEPLSAETEELATQAEAGRGSHELLPRMVFAIAEKLRREAGELAVARLVELLRSRQLDWPDPMRYRPSAEPEEIERSRRRRLAEVRESFANQSLQKTAECMLGVVKAWGLDYPERGTPLWEETVLEAVAAGLRAELMREAFEVLRRDREQILARTQDAIGKQLSALHQVLESGVRSLEQANQAASASLHVLDEFVPDLAWQHVRSQLPRARGEWGG